MVSGDRVICVSEVIKRYILRHYSVDEKKVRVIQRGVDMNLFDPDNTDQEFIRDFKKKYFLENRFIVTSVGRVTYLKDYETFIRAISICRESIPNIVGIIVGSVREDKISYLESLESLVRELGIESNVIFTGGQSRMPEIYQLSDVVVNVSLKMGNVGRTVVEALAMNTPVLATTFEGLENLVVDYRNGFLVTNQDPNGLCERILQLYTSPITETRSSIRTEYTLDAMVEDTLAIYRSLLDERADIRAVA
jgi:glycosyltransferase involved in cell wall biosynthesis